MSWKLVIWHHSAFFLPKGSDKIINKCEKTAANLSQGNAESERVEGQTKTKSCILFGTWAIVDLPIACIINSLLFPHFIYLVCFVRPK